MPDKTIPNVGCDIFLDGAWWGFRDRKMHAIEVATRLRTRSLEEIKIHDRETGDVMLILLDGQLRYVGEPPPSLTFEDIWPGPSEP